MSMESQATTAPERPGRVTGRTQAQRRQEAEQRILGAAIEIIAARGVDQLTLAEAGEAAGYSRALPAHYFGSREELVAAVARHLVDNYRRRMVAKPMTPPAKRGLEALLEGIAEYIDDNLQSITRLRAFHEVLNAGLNRPTIAPIIAQVDRESAAGFAHSIRGAIRRGEVRADLDPDLQGVMVLATLRGVMRQWLISPERIDLAAVRAELIDGLRRNWSPG